MYKENIYGTEITKQEDAHNRVCCLYRVSTMKQFDKEQDDIPMQKIACRNFCDQNGWKIVMERSEKGVSGYKVSANDRDAIQDIKRAAMKGDFDILLVFMFDRLGRKEDETPFVVQWFVQQGIEVWSTQEGQQRFDSHVDKLMNYIRFWQASGESEKTSIRTSTSMGQMVLEGHFKGGCRPFGYNLVKNGRVNKRDQEVFDLEVNPYEAAIVVEIFQLYTDKGMGTHTIAMYLTGLGIKSMSGSWHPATILNMLKNILYTGVLRSGRSRSEPHPHLRIIDDEMYGRAQELISECSRKNEKRSTPMTTNGRSLLSGNIFCGHCGSRLIPTSSGRAYTKKDGTKTPKRSCYVCYGSTRKRADCDGPRSYTCRMVDELVENAVRAIFTKLNDNPADTIMAEIYKYKQLDITEQLKKANAELQEAEKVVAALRQELVKSVMGNSALSQEDINAAL